MPKFTVTRQSLLDALSKAAAAIKPNANKPILSNALLTCDGNRLSIAGTDLERYVKVEIECDGEGCSVAINAARLLLILRSAADETVQFSPTKGGVEIICGRARWNVQTEDAGNFPARPKIGDGVSFNMACNALSGALKQVAFCVDPSSTRYALDSILIEGGGKALAFVATDGRRILACELPIETKAVSCLLPASGASLFQRALPDGGECVATADTSWFSAAADGVEIAAKLAEGIFPKWRDVMPNINGCAVDLNVDTFSLAIGQVAIACDEEFPGALIEMGDGTFRLKTQTTTGEAFAEFPVAYDGQSLSVELNSRSLGDMLKAIGEETVEFHCNGDDSAALFVWENCRHVIVPIKRRKNGR